MIDLARRSFVAYKVHGKPLLEAVRSIPGAKYDAKADAWMFPISCAAYVAEYANDHAVQMTESARLAVMNLVTHRDAGIDLPDLDAPLINGRTLFAHQKEGIRFLIRRRYAILADQMGLGKTCQALVAAAHLGAAIHVICPASLRDNWQREASDLGIKIQTHSWAKVPARLLAPYILIGDECFPANTIVSTDAGDIPIGRIVDSALPVRVASVACDGSVEYRPIARYIRKTNTIPLYRITHEHGTLVCTGNHPIYTFERGYIAAEEAARLAPYQNLHMSVLRGDVRHAVGRKRDVLLEDVLKPQTVTDAGVRSPAPACAGEIARGDQEARADQTPGCSRQNEAEQPDAHARSQGEGAPIVDGQEVQPSGWERTHYQTATGAFGPFEFAYGSGRQDSACPAPISSHPPSLQGGPFAPRVEDGDRGRREVAPAPGEYRKGPKENGRLDRSRLLSIEVLECSDRRIPGDRCGCHCTVYNLEVEHTHSYFADGVLVGNCHYIQSGNKSQRGKSFLALTKDADAVFCLTGTPMKNGRPVNLYPLLKAVRSPLAADKSWYERRYCDVKQTAWSRWDTSGACRLPELGRRCAPVMLRRMKDECLDLPEKIRVMRQADVTADARRAYEAELDRLVSRSEKEPDALAMFTYLRMASSQAKVEAACTVIDEVLEQGGSIVVFTAFLSAARTLAARYDDAALLIGETAQDERQRLVDAFQAGQRRVFVTTFGAGGVGITLTKAQTVLLVDRPWTPGDCYQAEDRIHRIGQTGSSVLSIWLQWDDTDKAVDALLEAKTERIEVVMHGRKVEVEANISLQRFAEMATRK